MKYIIEKPTNKIFKCTGTQCRNKNDIGYKGVMFYYQECNELLEIITPYLIEVYECELNIKYSEFKQ